MKLFSTDFQAGGVLPRPRTIFGKEIPPNIFWGGVPNEAKELALVAFDNNGFIHWLVSGIPVYIFGIVNDAVNPWRVEKSWSPPQVQIEITVTFAIFALRANVTVPAEASFRQLMLRFLLEALAIATLS